MKLKITRFDVAEHLDTPEMISAYLAEVFSHGDARHIAHALGNVARAKGMTDIAKRSGLTRESLYRALSDDGNPEFATILKVLSLIHI